MCFINQLNTRGLHHVADQSKWSEHDGSAHTRKQMSIAFTVLHIATPHSTNKSTDASRNPFCVTTPDFIDSSTISFDAHCSTDRFKRVNASCESLIFNN